jgi:hypothetical protein
MTNNNNNAGDTMNTNYDAKHRAFDRNEFYADDEIWDHEFCADGDACDNNCPFTND